MKLSNRRPQIAPDLGALKRLANPNYRDGRNNLYSMSPIKAALMRYGARLKQACIGYCFCITSDQHMALVPPGSRQGDIVCIVLGMQMPYILCQVETNDIAFESITTQVQIV
jgi:hypothetical protein